MSDINTDMATGTTFKERVADFAARAAAAREARPPITVTFGFTPEGDHLIEVDGVVLTSIEEAREAISRAKAK
jgi:hypothetical protein